MDILDKFQNQAVNVTPLWLLRSDQVYNISGITRGMGRYGLWTEAKERVDYGRRCDDGGRYPPVPCRCRGEVERIGGHVWATVPRLVNPVCDWLS